MVARVSCRAIAGIAMPAAPAAPPQPSVLTARLYPLNVQANQGGFGRIHSEVLGAAPRFNSGQRGIANAFGAKGVNAQCEYVITGPALGTGVCLFSDAAKYQLHFGG